MASLSEPPVRPCEQLQAAAGLQRREAGSLPQARGATDRRVARWFPESGELGCDGAQDLVVVAVDGFEDWLGIGGWRGDIGQNPQSALVEPLNDRTKGVFRRRSLGNERPGIEAVAAHPDQAEGLGCAPTVDQQIHQHDGIGA